MSLSGVTGIDDDPLWYRNAVIYQIPLRSFADGNGDGIGDFRGLTQRLQHVQDLGATAVWLLPFYPSPLRDGGYDIAEYTGVHPDYGTLRDFRRFVAEAHRRGLRVIIEVVVNHTSDRHKWFQRARRSAPGSTWRDFYVWSDSDEKYSDARIIFSDFETSNWTWDSMAGAFYWHRFYAHQPDLNFDNPAVRAAVLEVVDFWLDLGVDGLRLDAVPYLFEREGTSCENLPETHEFLRALRAHVDGKYPDRMLLAEANQWPEDTRAYFGSGDECHMAFNFPVMPRMYMAVQMEDRYPLVDILQQTPEIPAGAQWALFLRNHDELTLEMVTDEERDYMYRVYAADQRARINLGIRRRLAPLLGNDRRKIELLNALLLCLPGTPIIYYGDEIGMGDNIYLGDRDGVRTPMQWSADRNAGFSTANPQQLFLPVNIDPEYRFESVNVAAQQANPHSLLLWTRRLITLRQQHRVFGSGDIQFLFPDNPKVLCFVRSHGEDVVLVVANLSRFAQYVELDLSAFRGWIPEEMLGGTAFPRIGDLPYLMTLGPYAFHWFALRPATADLTDGPDRIPSLTTSGGFEALVATAGARRTLADVLSRGIRTRRWFSGKARKVNAASIVEWLTLPLGAGREPALIVLLEIGYVEGETDTYVVPLMFVPEGEADAFLADRPAAALAQARRVGESGRLGLVADAMGDGDFAHQLLDAIGARRRIKGQRGTLRGVHAKGWRELTSDTGGWPVPSRAEQSNTSVVFGDRLILKLFRRVEIGVNPEWELGRFLTEKAEFRHTPAMAGALEYQDREGNPRTICVVEELVPNEGDAWSYTLSQLSSYYEMLPGLSHGRRRDLVAPGPLAGLARPAPPDLAQELIGPMLGNAELLGRRTAQMHLALASGPSSGDMAPEAFTTHYQRSLYQSIRGCLRQALTSLRRSRFDLPADTAALADQVLAGEPDLYSLIADVKDLRIAGLRMRIHGDYHLGQILFTGRDFVVIDFEGEPSAPISVRRIKRSPLRDVAGMLRSFEYAAQVALVDYAGRDNVRAGGAAWDLAQLGARFWCEWVGSRFLAAYLDSVESRLLVENERSSGMLLRSFLIEKACYELEYELNNRPEWVAIPLRGLLGLLRQSEPWSADVPRPDTVSE